MIVYSSQYLFSLKSCASVLSWDVKNRLSDLGIEWRKRGVRAGKQIKERHCNLRPISSRITSHSIEDDNKRLTHRYVDRSLLYKIPHQKIYRIPVILTANLRSLSNKVDELHYIAECNNADAVCISESWLSPQIPDPAVAIPGNNLFRNDCTSAPGGGSVFIWEKPYRSMHSIISMLASGCGIFVPSLRPHNLPRSISSIILCVVYHSTANGQPENLVLSIQI